MSHPCHATCLCVCDSDTTGPLPIVSDDTISSEHEVHTSDYTSTDDDDFQRRLAVIPAPIPFADEPIDDPPAEYLPLVVIPAPIPLAVYPAYDLLLDAEADGDVDLFEDEPFEDEIPDAAPLPAGDLLMITGAPVEDSPAHSPVPDSFESVASAPSHEVSAPHFVHDSDPDQASSAAPIPSYAFEHDDIEDSDPPALAPEQAVALDPVHEHDLVHAGVPDEPILADPPVGDHLVDIPLIVDDHVIAGDPVVDPPFVDPPLIADIPVDHPVEHVAPVDPVIAPFDPVPLEPEHALFADHMDPPDEEAQHGWIPADEDVPPLPPQIPVTRHDDFSFQIPQFVPPAGPGEGSSAHPFGHVPMPMPFMPQMSSVPSSVSPVHAAPFDPTSMPLLWSSSSPMPPTDTYHPFHMGYTIEDVLMSFVHQHESHTKRLQELERAQMPPCSCHGQIHSPLQPGRSLLSDFAARLFTLEQQVASVIRTQ
ncbi:hypothetical protein HanIR_Chr08g0385841 [Helianthus annuus]|nr:hypothetical protein HanIR_Chr08g0385841 [Helianthus annuus]